MYRLVLLDRDGVLNHCRPRKCNGHPENYIKTPAEWAPIVGSPQAVAVLNARGCRVAVCTNQSGIGRGLMSDADLAAVHRRMGAALEGAGARIDRVYFCPHRPDEGCACRKPMPGMLQAAMTELGASERETCFVGDSLRDMQAALAAGCEPILVRTGNGSRDEKQARSAGVRRVYDDLAAAIRSLPA